MSDIIITFGDGQSVSVESGATGLDAIQDFPEGRKKRLVAMKIGDQIVDLL